MKVIERGTTAWNLQFQCVTCLSKLEADVNDLRSTHHPGYSDPRESTSTPEYWTFHVECSVCKERRNIPSTEIPRILQLKLEGRKID
jgi:hypothetical protein